MPGGGLIPVLDVIVHRKYPVMFVETLEDGSRIIRNERDEQTIAQKYQVCFRVALFLRKGNAIKGIGATFE
jgi:hypothetical protein